MHLAEWHAVMGAEDHGAEEHAARYAACIKLVVRRPALWNEGASNGCAAEAAAAVPANLQILP